LTEDRGIQATRLVKGYFVIAVNEYTDTQYGEKECPETWCVSSKKYCSAINTSKIRKFDSYERAQQYIDLLNPKYKKNREHEIKYLTVCKWENNRPDDGALGSWHDVTSTKDAIEIDLKQISEEKRASEFLRDKLTEVYALSSGKLKAKNDLELQQLELKIKAMAQHEIMLRRFLGQ
jgi:hypothetical protein